MQDCTFPQTLYFYLNLKVCARTIQNTYIAWCIANKIQPAFSVGLCGKWAANPIIHHSKRILHQLWHEAEVKLPPTTQFQGSVTSCWWYLAVDGVLDADRHPIEQTLLLPRLCVLELGLAFLHVLRDAVCFSGNLEGLGKRDKAYT